MKNTHQIAKGLGWFSIGLGLAELFDPQALENFLGVSHREGLLRFYGAREAICGVGILASKKPDSAWLWARVVGDVMDIAALSEIYAHKHAKKGNVTMALASVLGITALDVLCARELAA